MLELSTVEWLGKTLGEKQVMKVRMLRRKKSGPK
jgi:hypothetical protein